LVEEAAFLLGARQIVKAFGFEPFAAAQHEEQYHQNGQFGGACAEVQQVIMLHKERIPVKHGHYAHINE